MKLRIWILFLVLCPLLGYSAEIQDGGSGDGPASSASPAVTVKVNQNAAPDDDDDDFTFTSSGDNSIDSRANANKVTIPSSRVTLNPPEDEDVAEEGSGDGSITPTKAAVTKSSDPNTRCTSLYCWCIYNDGTEVPRTRVYAQPAKDCAQYAMKTTTVAPTVLPTRQKETPQPHDVKEVTEKETEDWTFDVVEMKSTIKPPVVIVKSTTTMTPTIDNKITVRPPPKVFNEDKEEESNVISQAAVQRESIASGAVLIEHPGILAAIIGGAVVGLLCFILLIMFIVYRMRKKDEGSYPLNDSKPLKNYAYAKAPSREFYA